MISIIIPAYNIQEYIGRTLKSVLAQTYSNIEIIVVDDGSNDGTAAVIDDYANQYSEKIRAIHIQNAGVTSARLIGVENANGEWIGFVDGDDVIEPNMFERLLDNAQKYHADISHCGYQMIFPDGRVNYFYNTGCIEKQSNTIGLVELLDGSKVEPGLCNKLFRKTLFCRLLQDNLMDKSITINEDLLMNYYLFKEADISVFEDFCPYHYIVRSTSASRQMLNKHKIYDPIKVKEKILHDSAPDIRKKAEQAYFGTYINVYNSIILSDISEIDMDRRYIRDMIISNWKYLSGVTRKQRLLARMIRYTPTLYKPIYHFYAAYLSKKRYS